VQNIEQLEQCGKFRKRHHITVTQPLKPGKDLLHITILPHPKSKTISSLISQYRILDLQNSKRSKNNNTNPTDILHWPPAPVHLGMVDSSFSFSTTHLSAPVVVRRSIQVKLPQSHRERRTTRNRRRGARTLGMRLRDGLWPSLLRREPGASRADLKSALWDREPGARCIYCISTHFKYVHTYYNEYSLSDGHIPSVIRKW